MAEDENRVEVLEQRIKYLEERLEAVENALKSLIRDFMERNTQDERNTEAGNHGSNSIPVTPTWNPMLFEENSRSGHGEKSFSPEKKKENPWLGGVARVCAEISESMQRIEKQSEENIEEACQSDSATTRRLKLVGKEIDKAMEVLVGQEQGMGVNQSEESTSSESSIRWSEIQVFHALSAYDKMPTDDSEQSSFAELFDYSGVFKPSPEKLIEYKTSPRYKRAREAVKDDGQKLKKIRRELKEFAMRGRSFGQDQSTKNVGSKQSQSNSKVGSDKGTVYRVTSQKSLKGKSSSGKAEWGRKRGPRGSSTTSRRRVSPNSDINLLVIDMVGKICREESRALNPSMPRWYLPVPYATTILSGSASINSMISHFRTSDRVMSSLENCEQIFIPINDGGVWPGQKNDGEGLHWYLLVLDFNKRKVLIFDSNEPYIAEDRERRLEQIRQVFMAGDREFGNLTEWDYETPRSVPQQQNTYDCGMFVATFMMELHLYKYTLVDVNEGSRFQLATTMISHQLNKMRTRAIEFIKDELKLRRSRC
ncbi:Peptidase C48, SUMO/Sentrin/Ubl1 [Corchorus capsularis]|uniref:Peptidase C48, SUMO/Sentrin/Ubl1 n=1 Tax=Corchorus capsularis TaxID=210143 RepID=A0A1R3K9N5_COCAP|nr:Peptidase C48, SUMO/Sentrin/Ubl1 [Corchorus capsularis]